LIFFRTLPLASYLRPIRLPLLDRLLRHELVLVVFKKLRQLLRIGARDIVKGGGRDVVGLPLSYEAVVLEQVLDFGLVLAGIAEDAAGFVSDQELDPLFVPR
jgi:hypothetical protein